MKILHITQGKSVLVDDEDFEWLNQYKWYASKNRNNFYAMRDIWINGKKGTPVKMHRAILGLVAGDNKISDHKNRNGLDNRRENLRIVGYSLNNYNTEKIRKNNTSGYRGVCWCERDNAWRSYIRINGKQKSCGYYPDAISAAKAHDNEIIKYRGNDAILNFPGGKA